jgi:NAD(P)-dependent dehydrogenase (short-subunit alcohol dehydrogenase family)
MILIIGFVLFIYVIYRIYERLFPAPNIDPRGRYVLISGCDSGFGNALAIELDKQGFNVLAGVYTPDNAKVLADQLSSQATVFPLDITRQQDIDAAYELIKSKTNVLHALVNNAGISSGGHIDWISTESMRQMMDVNFFGHVAMTKTFLPLLITKRNSRVVNITSVAGFICPPSGSAYCASKYAFEAFSDCLRREMSVWGLRVSIIEPGVMRTPIVQKHGQTVRQLRMQLSADILERWGEEFFSSYAEQLKSNVLVKLAEDPVKVVRALHHAILSTSPCIRYRPGWQSKFVYFPLSIIPAWVSDFYFIRARSSTVLPAGTKTQLPM